MASSSAKKFRPEKDLENKDEYAVESLDNYLNIWQVNPSYKDINNNVSIVKAVSLISLGMFFIISIYSLTLNFMLSILFGITIIVVFIAVFHDNFFSLKNLFSYSFRRYALFDPFENLKFFISKENPSVLFCSNKADLITVATSFFKVEVIPEKIHPTLYQFIRSLDELAIPYSYQVVQAPFINNIPENLKTVKPNQKINSMDSFKTLIYFSVYYYIKSILNKKKISTLLETISEYIYALESNFSANFYHFNVSRLYGKELVKALRTFVLKNNSIQGWEKDNFIESKNPFPKIMLKILFISFIIGCSSFILIHLGLSLIFIGFFDFIIALVIILIWWRELISQFSIANIQRDIDLKIINPFKDVTFFRFKGIPESIFYNIGNILLVDLKAFNLIHASPNISLNSTFCRPDKFYRALIGHKIPFVYTLIAAPISYHGFNKEGYKYLKLKAKNWLSGVKSDMQYVDWLRTRSGIWKTILNISTSSYKFINETIIEDALSLENELKVKANIVKNAFKANFPSFELIYLRKRELLSGFLCEVLKNKFFRLNGTHLNYLLFQGFSLVQLTQIADELKKGVETRVASEFNTPLSLENFISIGSTINTEFLKEEIPVGFLFEQLKNLLIVNGTSESREYLSMTIVSELIKVNIPSLIFDFTGNWSKLINFFNDSAYDENCLFFKLGSAFTLDPIRSEIPYDKNNIDFLEYMFDAYAMAFKKDEKHMDMFKNTILRNPEMDISTLSLELKSQQEWQKSPMTNALIALFDEFTQKDFVFFRTSGEDNESKITIQDFINNNRTVIIDLSISNDFKKQVFLMFVVLSKIIHYIKNFSDPNFCEKFLVIPHIDLFFDGWYLDKTSNYGKVDKFLEPLIQEGFGLILSANQIRYLHPNVFNYFENIISFRATDKRDIAVIRNQMNLEEVFGKGYYSSKRNTPYQIDYLMRMKRDNILIKRTDVNQPFPAKIDFTEFKKIMNVDYSEIIDYMKRQGYDLKRTEKRLLEQAKRTLFEKDLGDYTLFLPEIMKFLKSLSSLDDVKNLYKRKIKEELMKIIYTRVIKITKDKRKITAIRDKLFDILVKHDYLVENHGKTAAGSDSIRISYAVGPKYNVALNDYFASKKDYSTEVYFETLEKESLSSRNFEEVFKEYRDIDDKNGDTLIDALAECKSKLYLELYRVYKLISRKKYKDALMVEKDFFKKFLVILYKNLYQVNFVITSKDLNDFVKYLSKNKKFPFTNEEFQKCLIKCESIEIKDGDLKSRAENMYDFLSDFFNMYQNRIIKG